MSQDLLETMLSKFYIKARFYYSDNEKMINIDYFGIKLVHSETNFVKYFLGVYIKTTNLNTYK